MPSNWNEGVTTSESGSNVASIISKTDAYSSPMVAMNPEVSNVGDKSGYLNLPFLPSNVTQMRMRLLIQVNFAPIWLQSFQNQLSAAVLWLQLIMKPVL